MIEEIPIRFRLRTLIETVFRRRALHWFWSSRRSAGLVSSPRSEGGSRLRGRGRGLVGPPSRSRKVRQSLQLVTLQPLHFRDGPGCISLGLYTDGRDEPIDGTIPGRVLALRPEGVMQRVLRRGQCSREAVWCREGPDLALVDRTGERAPYSRSGDQPHVPGRNVATWGVFKSFLLHERGVNDTVN